MFYNDAQQSINTKPPRLLGKDVLIEFRNHLCFIDHCFEREREKSVFFVFKNDLLYKGLAQRTKATMVSVARLFPCSWE